MNSRVVAVGDCIVAHGPDTSLVTYALGSCLAVSIYDPVARVGGLLHLMLPESGAAAGQVVEFPFRYADTGTPLLFRMAYGMGAEKKRLRVSVAGGAAVVEDHGLFNIGKRNMLALRKILWRAGVLIHAEDVGGNFSRTVRLDLDTGKLWIRSAGDAGWALLEARRAGYSEIA